MMMLTASAPRRRGGAQPIEPVLDDDARCFGGHLDVTPKPISRVRCTAGSTTSDRTDARVARGEIEESALGVGLL